MARAIFKDENDYNHGKRVERPEKFDRRVLRKNKAIRGALFA